MKRLIYHIRNKVTSRRGESLGEVLVALLVSALAITLLAGAIVTAGRIITQSKGAMQEYYEKNNALSYQLSQRASSAETMKITFDGAKPLDEVSEATVNLYTNQKYNDVAAYRKG